MEQHKLYSSNVKISSYTRAKDAQTGNHVLVYVLDVVWGETNLSTAQDPQEAPQGSNPSSASSSWRVRKRVRDFQRLHGTLTTYYGAQVPHFPSAHSTIQKGWRMLRSSTSGARDGKKQRSEDAEIRQRMVRLEQYLRCVIDYIDTWVPIDASAAALIPLGWGTLLGVHEELFRFLHFEKFATMPTPSHRVIEGENVIVIEEQEEKRTEPSSDARFMQRRFSSEMTDTEHGDGSRDASHRMAEEGSLVFDELHEENISSPEKECTPISDDVGVSDETDHPGSGEKYAVSRGVTEDLPPGAQKRRISPDFPVMSGNKPTTAHCGEGTQQASIRFLTVKDLQLLGASLKMMIPHLDAFFSRLSHTATTSSWLNRTDADVSFPADTLGRSTLSNFLAVHDTDTKFLAEISILLDKAAGGKAPASCGTLGTNRSLGVVLTPDVAAVLISSLEFSDSRMEALRRLCPYICTGSANVQALGSGLRSNNIIVTKPGSQYQFYAGAMSVFQPVLDLFHFDEEESTARTLLLNRSYKIRSAT